MAEMCAYCAAPFGSPAELITHVRKAHSGGDSQASLAMNPESQHPGFVCAMCGRRFWTTAALTHHNLSPHARRPRAGDVPATRPTTS